MRIYSERTVIDKFNIGEAVSAMAFGKYDGHQGVLVLATANGRLVFKYIKEGVDVSGLGIEGGVVPVFLLTKSRRLSHILHDSIPQDRHRNSL